MPKVLLYNWAPIIGTQDRGGGVSIYLRNIAAGLAARGVDVYVLSGGCVYNPFYPSIYVRERKRFASGGIRYFDIVNSPVLAPSFMMFAEPEVQLVARSVEDAFAKFLMEHGRFLAVHIQNFEGIPFSLVRLKAYFPMTKFILSNHNYHVVCPQVNLWYRDAELCTDYQDGARCAICNVFLKGRKQFVKRRNRDYIAEALGLSPDHWTVRAIALGGCLIGRALTKIGLAECDTTAKPCNTFSPIAAERFRRRREDAVRYVNQYCDAILSVSEATRTIVEHYGLAHDKGLVLYIGTRHFNGTVPKSNRRPLDGRLTLCFLGYTRPDKGFHFLVEAIDRMPGDLWGRIGLKVAARITDWTAVRRLEAMQDRLLSLDIKNGYAHNELPEILRDVQLGLVLPLWSDCMPQVAIEFVCYGVPILVADRGGQEELAAHEAFVFESGSTDAFWDKVSLLAAQPELFGEFWERPRPLRTITQHLDELLTVYGAPSLYGDSSASYEREDQR